MNRTILYGCLAAVLLISLTTNAYRLKTRVVTSPGTSILDASNDLKSIVGENAVISGPYAAVLTLNNDLKSFIHLFGVASVDSTLFQRYPITHLAIDSSNWLEAVKNYPVLKDMNPITAYSIRNFGVKICNVAALLGNPEARRYRKTKFEQAVSYYYQGHSDSAMAAVKEFLRTYPDCRSANLLLVELLMQSASFKQAATILTGLAGRFPSDYTTNLVCGRSFQIMGLVKNERGLLALSRMYYGRAIGNNPDNRKYVTYLYELTLEQFDGQADSDGEEP